MQPTCCGTAAADIETVSSMRHARQDRDGDGNERSRQRVFRFAARNRRRATAPTDVQIHDGVAQELGGRGAMTAYCCRRRTVRPVEQFVYIRRRRLDELHYLR